MGRSCQELLDNSELLNLTGLKAYWIVGCHQRRNPDWRTSRRVIPGPRCRHGPALWLNLLENALRITSLCLRLLHHSQLPGIIQTYRFADWRMEGELVDDFPFVDVDRAAYVSF